MDLEKLRYPVGKFHFPETISSDDISTWIAVIENAPAQIAAAAQGLSDEQLDIPYRPEGWTLRQVIHHMADSHLNSYIRFKWTLTEEEPIIKAYEEKDWAELEEAKNAPVEISLNLLKALHARWVLMLKNLSEEDLERKFTHPETGNKHSIKWLVALYAWHSKHHLGHITSLKERMGW